MNRHPRGGRGEEACPTELVKWQILDEGTGVKVRHLATHGMFESGNIKGCDRRGAAASGA